MKNIFLICLSFLVVFVSSCSDDDKSGPTSLEIGGEKTNLEFSHKKGSESVDIITNAWDVSIVMDASGDGWCTMERKGRYLQVNVAYNSIETPRSTSITIVADNNTSVLNVTQAGLETSAGYETKLKVAKATASSQEIKNDDTGIENSFDGDYQTFWHTGWSDTAPYTVTYTLQDAERLDYIMYYPRVGGGNGNFGEFEIYVSTEENPEFVKIIEFDNEKSGNPAKIVLPESIKNPKEVKFNILSGANGNASCSEMEFYSVTEGSVKTVEIPIGGNTYVTEGETIKDIAERGGRMINDMGIINWSSTDRVYSTYFKVNKSGDLLLYLKYAPDGDGNVINVTCGNKTFKVTLPGGDNSSLQKTVYIGVLENVDPGYVKVDMQGVTKQGSTFGMPTALLVGGDAVEDINFVGDFSYYWGRRGPSVHMKYTLPTLPTTENVEWFYNEVTVPENYDPLGTYYMANGFGEGYFGFQTKSETNRWILFSVWSPFETDDPSSIPLEDRVLLVKKGDGVSTGEFGSEGSGGQSYWEYMWKTGTTYKFLNRVRPLEDGYTEYTAYFFAPEIGNWKLIAQWKRPKTQTYYTNAHSFLENFNPHMGGFTRKANYSNQWVYTTKGRWLELTAGTFTVDETGNNGWRKDFSGGVNGTNFFLQNCGFFNETTAYNSKFTRPSLSVAPEIDWTTLE